MTPENSGPKQADGQFQKGVSGNPAGKPKGALNHATRAAQTFLDGEADALTRKCIEMAGGRYHGSGPCIVVSLTIN